MEYPPLFDVTNDILRAGNWSSDFGTRRGLSLFLKESLKKAEEDAGPTVTFLHDIASNLHNPRPPAPTLAEAREAARLLGGPSADIVHRFLDGLEAA